MALGYGPGRLVRSYLEAILGLALVGGALGLVVAFPLRDVFATTSGHSMGMPDIRLTTDGLTMSRGFVYEVLVALLATAVPVLRLVVQPPPRGIRESPARAL